MMPNDSPNIPKTFWKIFLAPKTCSDHVQKVSEDVIKEESLEGKSGSDYKDIYGSPTVTVTPAWPDTTFPKDIEIDFGTQKSGEKLFGEQMSVEQMLGNKGPGKKNPRKEGSRDTAFKKNILLLGTMEF